MPDLLAHVFLAYALLRALSWRYDWLTTPYVTAGMAGAFIPDIVKIQLLLPSATVEAALGIPFSWSPIHRLGGTAICLLIGAVLVDEARRRNTLLVLSVGAASHLLADALLTKATNRSFAILWPLTRWQPPTPGLYLSTQPEPTIMTGLLAAAVWGVSRWRDRAQ
jgi:membrane-bound metal-dependent hydrolase YbcI (DUF457 family)